MHRHLRNFVLYSLVPITALNLVLFNLVSVCHLIWSPRLSLGKTIKTPLSNPLCVIACCYQYTLICSDANTQGCSR